MSQNPAQMPTPTQALLLFGLLARHGECAQAELMPAIKKADREALAKAKFVSVDKVGRGLKLKLEDAGWAWAAAHLSAELPPAQRALSDMLMRLDAHLTKRRVTLADFIGSKPEPPTKLTGKTGARIARASNKPTRKATTPATNPKVDEAKGVPVISPCELIERAYFEVSEGKFGTEVAFAKLRGRLTEIDRRTFDAALVNMHLEGRKVRLLRIENQRAISDQDREAELQFKGNVFHALWIEP